MKLLKIILMLGVAMGMNAGLKVGDKAPKFTLPDETGQIRTLSEFGNKKIVLFFYPKDGSRNCTKEACSLRDANAEYQKHGIVVLGISYDSPESHRAFKEKYHLPFLLLSDSDRWVAKAYGLGSTGIFGRITNYFFPDRITFLIENRKIVHILKDINVATQSDDILRAFGIEPE